MRGEYVPVNAWDYIVSGSSPRAWGIPSAPATAAASRRFIPTCVGNTPTQPFCAEVLTVHPHVRGEYDSGGLGIADHGGSSPRAWGILLAGVFYSPSGRFIPTCVGNTRGSHAASQVRSVHPHVRGEYLFPARPISAFAGSSPRAWGILSKYVWELKTARFIPTCVGNTSGVSTPIPTWSVHPHVRGEYEYRWRQNRTHNGSSPRAWGIQYAS